MMNLEFLHKICLEERTISRNTTW